MITEGMIPPEIMRQEKESRFGDKEKIREIMQWGRVIERGPIENIIPDIPTHANEVDVVDIPSNELEYVKLQSKSGVLTCIFKPFEGEDHIGQTEPFLFLDGQPIETQVQEIPAYYTREKVTEIIDDFFDFDLVPPVVIRKIGNRVGSLQLFISHDEYTNYSKSDYTVEEMMGDDLYAMALLDYITLQGDRKPDNFLINRKNSKELIANDNGVCFEWGDYEGAAMGPQDIMTSKPNPHFVKGETPAYIPDIVKIPEKLLEMLKVGYAKKEKLTEKLRLVKRMQGWKNKKLIEHDLPVSDLSEEDIEAMWTRIEELIHYGVFISPNNRDLVVETFGKISK